MTTELNKSGDSSSAPTADRDLVMAASADVVQALVLSDGARLSEAGLMAVLDRFPNDPSVLDAVIAVPELPPAVISKLAGLVGGEQRLRLNAGHPVPAEIRNEAHRMGRDRPRWWTQHLFSPR